MTTPAVFTSEQAAMTNTTAFVLAAIILGAIAADMFYYGTEHLIFLSKKLFDLIEWLAFWR